jgi:very-short-patch-repair endonuclease
MAHESALGALSRLSAPAFGVFRGRDAVDLKVSRKQLAALRAAGVIERIHADTYRMTAVPRSNAQSLRAALLWAGETAAAAGRSAGELYGLEQVHAPKPEIVIPRSCRVRSEDVVVHSTKDRHALLLRRRQGLQVTGVEPTLVALAASLESEAFEVACEDARRRGLTSVPALRSYLAQHAIGGRPGVAPLRALLDEIDPVHAARSTLEVKTRRLLVAHGFTEFVREFPLDWNNRRYLFDFAFESRRTILETNGRRWHDDPTDYEHDNEKWSVPGRHGYRLVFATWHKVTRTPSQLLGELSTTLAA